MNGLWTNKELHGENSKYLLSIYYILCSQRTLASVKTWVRTNDTTCSRHRIGILLFKCMVERKCAPETENIAGAQIYRQGYKGERLEKQVGGGCRMLKCANALLFHGLCSGPSPFPCPFHSPFSASRDPPSVFDHQHRPHLTQWQIDVRNLINWVWMNKLMKKRRKKVKKEGG